MGAFESLYRDVDGRPDRDDPRLHRRLPGGREDDDVVIARAQSLGELADVHLHPARIAPRVRTGQRDAHQPASSGHGRLEHMPVGRRHRDHALEGIRDRPA
jgi:hypothetical protein